MSKQYRIKQDGVEFIPQVRNFLFWRDIKVYKSSIMEYSTERVIDSTFKRCTLHEYSYGMVSLKKNRICFSSLEKAKKFINEHGKVVQPTMEEMVNMSLTQEVLTLVQ